MFLAMDGLWEVYFKFDLFMMFKFIFMISLTVKYLMISMLIFNGYFVMKAFLALFLHVMFCFNVFFLIFKILAMKMNNLSKINCSSFILMLLILLFLYYTYILIGDGNLTSFVFLLSFPNSFMLE